MQFKAINIINVTNTACSPHSPPPMMTNDLLSSSAASELIGSVRLWEDKADFLAWTTTLSPSTCVCVTEATGSPQQHFQDRQPTSTELNKYTKGAVKICTQFC